jgi:hypothetical protein
MSNAVVARWADCPSNFACRDRECQRLTRRDNCQALSAPRGRDAPSANLVSIAVSRQSLPQTPALRLVIAPLSRPSSLRLPHRVLSRAHAKFTLPVHEFTSSSRHQHETPSHMRIHTMEAARCGSDGTGRFTP